MHQLIMQGKILYWGTSEWSAQEIMEAHMFAKQNQLIGPVVEQPEYNMFCRDKVEVEFSQLYKTVGLGTTIWSPLASGVLTNKYLNKFPKGTRLGMDGLEWLKEKNLTTEKLEKVRELNRIAEELDLSLAQLGIIWCLKNENVSTVILGASNSKQLIENLKSIELFKEINQEHLSLIEIVLKN
ncbi:MAG: aldo/keto reductase, partial [Crocinitomicaceae bacterium]